MSYVEVISVTFQHILRGCHGSRDARKSECKEPAGLKSEYMGKTLILRKTGLSVCVCHGEQVQRVCGCCLFSD